MERAKAIVMNDTVGDIEMHDVGGGSIPPDVVQEFHQRFEEMVAALPMVEVQRPRKDGSTKTWIFPPVQLLWTA